MENEQDYFVSVPNAAGPNLPIRLLDMHDGDRGYIYAGGITFDGKGLYCNGQKQLFPRFEDEYQIRTWKEEGKLFVIPTVAMLMRPVPSTGRLPSFWRRLWIGPIGMGFLLEEFSRLKFPDDKWHPNRSEMQDILEALLPHTGILPENIDEFRKRLDRRNKVPTNSPISQPGIDDLRG